MECEKLIFIDDLVIENCKISNDVPKEIAEISETFVKVTDKSTIKYINLNYVEIIVPKKLKTISSC